MQMTNPGVGRKIRLKWGELCIHTRRGCELHQNISESTQNSEKWTKESPGSPPTEGQARRAQPRFGRTPLITVDPGVWRGRSRCSPNDGCGVVWTFPLRQPLYLPLYKGFTSSLHTHTSKLELNHKRLYCTMLYTRIGREWSRRSRKNPGVVGNLLLFLLFCFITLNLI